MQRKRELNKIFEFERWREEGGGRRGSKEIHDSVALSLAVDVSFFLFVSFVPLKLAVLSASDQRSRARPCVHTLAHAKSPQEKEAPICAPPRLFPSISREQKGVGGAHWGFSLKDSFHRLAL